MAIRKRKGRKVAYQVYWRNPFTSKQEMKTFADELEAKKYNSEIKHRLKYDKESFRPAETPSEGAVTYFQGLALRYLKERPMADSTRATSNDHLESFYRLIGNPKIEDIDKALMKKFERLCREKGLKQRTIHRKVSIVKSALNWGVEEEIIPGHNLQGYKCDKGEDAKAWPPSPSELKEIYKHAPPHLQRVITLGFSFGLRIGRSELFKLTWDDFDFERGIAHLPASKKNRNVVYRDVDIRLDLLKRLEEWRADDEARGIKHVIHYKGKPVSSIRKSWKTALEKAGIAGRRIRPYDLRHAFATQALGNGADLKAVAEIMGHSDTSMIHKHYQQVLNRQRRAAIDAIPSIE